MSHSIAELAKAMYSDPNTLRRIEMERVISKHEEQRNGFIQHVKEIMVREIAQCMLEKGFVSFKESYTPDGKRLVCEALVFDESRVNKEATGNCVIVEDGGRSGPFGVRAEGDEVRCERILEAVKEGAGVSLEELKGRLRLRNIVFSRFIVAKELYIRTCMSLYDIAVFLERDYKSIPYYLSRYEEDYRHSKTFRELADKIGGFIDGEI